MRETRWRVCEAPTLAIVGGNDPVVLELNRQALARMHCVKALHVIPGASHLFEEPGALEEVAKLARPGLARRDLSVAAGLAEWRLP